MSTILEAYGLSPDFLNRRVPVEHRDSFLCGAELEIEDISEVSSTQLAVLQVSCTEDGSLRNNGREFLLPPGTLETSVNTFTTVHKSGVRYGEDAFSSRTSTHVHVNVQRMSGHNVKALLLLYSIFEELSFNFVGEERANNIHCVPLSRTHMPNLYHLPLDYVVERWHKYTALNLIPIRNLGTVEFRHLGGTSDVGRYTAWLSFLKTLWEAARAMGEFTRRDVIHLEVLKNLEKQLLTEDFIKHCKIKPDFVLEDNLLDVKLAFL